jgi:hypothetical protein
MMTPTTSCPGPGDTKSEDFWLEERFWGHRLWDQQSPWLVFLEFLNVAESAFRSQTLFDVSKSHYPFAYYPYLRLHLRNIMFNGEQQLQTIAEKVTDSASAWRQWTDWMREQARGIDPDEREFSYLKQRFSSFQHFALLIRALKSSAVEGDLNKRWSSRFIFPFGRSSIFVDVDVTKDDRIESQYINFGRSGELLYQMLARSSRASELARVVPVKLLSPNKWDELVRLLQPDWADNRTIKRGAGVSSFLPYAAHPTFELIGQDWYNLLTLDLPGFDVVPYLVTIGAFGLFLYQLHTSAYILQRDRIPPMICEAVAPRKGLVRELSVDNFDTNSSLSMESVNAIFAQVESSDEWDLAGSPMDVLARRRAVLKREFRWEEDTGVTDPDDLWRNFKESARARHRQHFGQIHRSYGRGVGLVSRRGTNRLRYAPTDAFLKAVLFANVQKRMEFTEFLRHLFERYGLVFGEGQAEQILQGSDMDTKQFHANSLRLEQRLSSLGLLRRLSDSCAYVENPYSG